VRLEAEREDSVRRFRANADIATPGILLRIARIDVHSGA
jgi:hypothetical protein